MCGQDGEDRRPSLRPEVSLFAEEDPDMLECLVHGKLQMVCNSILANSWRESTETEPDLVGTGKACIMKQHTWLDTRPEMSERSGPLFERLVNIMATLRAPGGCPWDREQTRESLKPYLIEEAYEVLEALDHGGKEKLQEELGDLLLQVVFHAQVAAELEEFTVDEVLQNIADKLVRRHPHVFGETRAETAAEVLSNWEKLKQAERGGPIQASALAGVPKTLPALLRAQRLQDKAARVGFDWGETTEVLHKVEEELREFKAAIRKGPEAVESEMGDLLFSLVNLARFLRLSAEEALRKSIDKFGRRFRHIESAIAEQGKSLAESSLEEMDALWQEAKIGEDSGGGR
jgi:tetrapyrrole methylase family protein/MazG family protein